jgi:hypothetical protein
MSTLRAVELIKTAAENITGFTFITGTRLLNNIEADDQRLPLIMLVRPLSIPVTIASGGRLRDSYQCLVIFASKSELEYQFALHEPIVGDMRLAADQFFVNLNSFSDYVQSISSITYADYINDFDANLTGVAATFTLELIPLDEQVCPTGTFIPEDLPPFSRYLTEVAVDGVTITGNGTTEDPLVALGGGGGGGSLRVQDEGTTVTNAATSLNFTGNVTASLASAGNVTVNVPAETPQVNADWNASSGVAQILNKPTITPPQSLQEVTDVGNTTDNDIQFDAGVGILLNNTSRLREGTIDAGLGGNKGIAQICAVGYELKWEAGRLYVMDGNGILIRWSLYNFNVAPTVNDDNTKGYITGSRWSLDDGTIYLCSDGTTGAAVWTLQTSGGVTDVTATAPLSSTSGSTPDISISQADGSTDGYLSSTDWNTFDSKGNGTVTSVNAGTNISVTGTATDPIINSLADRYKTTSTTSNSVSNGSKNFTVDLNLSYIPLQEILVVHNPANHMHGEVTSYNPATGALVVAIKNHTGSGTYTAWTLNLDGTPVDALTGSGTANEIAYFTAARVLSSLPVATYPSLTELSYVKGVSSAIQTQLNGKQATLSAGTGISLASNTVTNTAPDQTVVINAGAGIGVSGSYPNFTIANTLPALPVKQVIGSATETSGTAITQLSSLLIEGGWLTANMMAEVFARNHKVGANNGTTIRLYLNDANNLTGAVLLATYGVGVVSASSFSDIMRRLTIVSSTETFITLTSQNTSFDIGATSTSILNINWATDKYLIVTGQDVNGADVTKNILLQIEKYVNS